MLQKNMHFLTTLLLISCFVGCVQKPIISDNAYLSPENYFQVTCPPGWRVSQKKPEWFPEFLTRNKQGYTEQIYFIKDSIKACAMVESYALIFNNKKVHPVEIVQYTYGKSTLKNALDYLDGQMDKIISQGSIIKSYQSETSIDLGNGLCEINQKCLINSNHLTYRSDPEFYSYGENYMVGKKFKHNLDALQQVVPIEKIPHTGWKINYIVFAPSEYKEETTRALKWLVLHTKEFHFKN